MASPVPKGSMPAHITAQRVGPLVPLQGHNNLNMYMHSKFEFPHTMTLHLHPMHSQYRDYICRGVLCIATAVQLRMACPITETWALAWEHSALTLICVYALIFRTTTCITIWICNKHPLSTALVLMVAKVPCHLALKIAASTRSLAMHGASHTSCMRWIPSGWHTL